MLCVYLGTDSRSYQDYVNAFTGRMLEAEPGFGVYDIQVAPGRNPGLPLPPGDGRWAAAPPAGEPVPFASGGLVPQAGSGEPETQDEASPEGEPALPDPAAEPAMNPEEE